jgi:hypothetical protein
MRQPLETPDNKYSRGEPEHAGLVDVPPTAPDWADVAASAWEVPSWGQQVVGRPAVLREERP